MLLKLLHSSLVRDIEYNVLIILGRERKLLYIVLIGKSYIVRQASVISPAFSAFHFARLPTTHC